MSWNHFSPFIVCTFMLVIIASGCENKAEVKTNEPGLTKPIQTVASKEYEDEDEGEADVESYDADISGTQYRYEVSPGDHLLTFSVKLPYSSGYDDMTFQVKKNELQSLDFIVGVEDVQLESYTHPIWTVITDEGFMGLQKELFTKVDGTWIISMSDVEETGRLPEEHIYKILSNKKYHYYNEEEKRMETSTKELSVEQIDGESYIAHVEVRMEIPDDEYTLNNKSIILEGNPAGKLKITLSRSNKNGPILIIGPNRQVPNE
jgi:hypothetical protein